MIPNARVPLSGLVYHVSLYNTTPDKKSLIWVVSYVPTDSPTLTNATLSLDYFFVVSDLSLNQQATLPQLTHKCSSQEAELALLLWEIRVRLHHPVLREVLWKPMWVQGQLTHEKVLVQVDRMEQLPLEHKGTYLTSAYLHGETNQQFPNFSDTESADGGLWFPSMFQFQKVTGLDVCLKTQCGTYTCGSHEEKAVKRKKVEGLTIEDVFPFRDSTLTVRGSQLKLRVLYPKFHVLWFNSECLWNSCLSEFFRALFHKTYEGFDGLEAVLAFVFPGATPEGTSFPPCFSSFPFLPLKVGRPQKLYPWQVVPSGEACILAHFQLIKNTNVADCLLLKGGTVPTFPLDIGDGCWPLWVNDMNMDMCEEGEGTRAVLNFPHTMITFNILPVLAQKLNLVSDTPLLTLQHLGKLGSPAIQKVLKQWYNLIIATVFQWSSQTGFSWVAIREIKMHLASSHIWNLKVS